MATAAARISTINAGKLTLLSSSSECAAGREIALGAAGLLKLGLAGAAGLAGEGGVALKLGLTGGGGVLLPKLGFCGA